MSILGVEKMKRMSRKCILIFSQSVAGQSAFVQSGSVGWYVIDRLNRSKGKSVV